MDSATFRSLRISKQPSTYLKPGKDGCGGHAWECQTAKSKISDCVCACDGKNHGNRNPNREYEHTTDDRRFIPGIFFDDDTCLDCGGQLGPWQDVWADKREPEPTSAFNHWWIRECTKCKYAWAEWKLVARGFKPHA